MDQEEKADGDNEDQHLMKDEEFVPGRNRSTEMLTTIALLKVFGKFEDNKWKLRKTKSSLDHLKYVLFDRWIFLKKYEEEVERYFLEKVQIINTYKHVILKVSTSKNLN